MTHIGKVKERRGREVKLFTLLHGENAMFGSYHLIQIPTDCREFYLVNHFDGKYTQSNDKLPRIHARITHKCVRIAFLAIRFWFGKRCVVASSQ